MKSRRVRGALLAAAALVFVIHATAWPLSSGRAGEFQLLYYLDFSNRDPQLPALAGYPPVAPLLFGGLLDHFGGHATELMLGGCFSAAIWFAYRSGTAWGDGTGLMVAALLLLHASYGALFHRIDSDVLFATVFLAWLSDALRNAAVHNIALYARHGLLVALLILTRPTNVVFLAFVLYPLCFSSSPLAQRLLRAAAFMLAAGAVLSGWALVEHARFGQVGSRFRNAAPMYGLMANTRSVGPQNGPASAALAEAVQQEILTQEPYKSRGIDLQRFFSDGSGRAYEALVALSDRKWGWESKYRILGETVAETIQRNPGEFILAVNRVFVHTFILRDQFPVQWPASPVAPDFRETGEAKGRDEPAADRRTFPPAELAWHEATPDQRYAHATGRDLSASLYSSYRNLRGRSFGYRHGSPVVAEIVNAGGKPFVPMIVFLGVAFLGMPFLAVRTAVKPAEIMLILMVLMAVGLMLLSSALVPATLEYRLPLDPLFLLAALVGGRALVRGRRVLAAAGS
jgi:hypothetical protein